MKQSEMIAVARALRIALGYESREVRIAKLAASSYLDVRALYVALTQAGLLTDISASESVMIPFDHKT